MVTCKEYMQLTMCNLVSVHDRHNALQHVCYVFRSRRRISSATHMLKVGQKTLYAAYTAASYNGFKVMFTRAYLYRIHVSHTCIAYMCAVCLHVRTGMQYRYCADATIAPMSRLYWSHNWKLNDVYTCAPVRNTGMRTGIAYRYAIPVLRTGAHV